MASFAGALGAPTLGHRDPQYLAIMDDTCARLREVFRTTNLLTFPVSGTGMAGMECVAVNLIEPGDEVIVGLNGVFGSRMKDVMERCGATVHAVEAPWGEVITLEQLQAALTQHPKVKLVGIVHAETSTGAHQPLEGFADAIHAQGALFAVDAVTSLGGHELRVDDWGIDAIYSGTQKCLSCPPGLAPVSFGERALARMDARKSKVQSWYLDVSMLRKYYTGGGGGGRVYHHTAPINMTYALHEALGIILEEGLENRIARHEQMHHRLVPRGRKRWAKQEATNIGYIPEALIARLELRRHSPSAPMMRAPAAVCSRSTASKSGPASASWPGKRGGSASWATARPCATWISCSRR